MPSLNDILSETFLLQLECDASERRGPLDSPDEPVGFYERPFWNCHSWWSWSQWKTEPSAISLDDLKHEYSHIDPLTVQLVEPRTEVSLVCRRIEWKPVELVVRGVEYIFEYKLENFIASYHAREGRFIENEAGNFWRLGVNVTAGFLLVYGFQLDQKTGEMRPIPKTIINSSEFMPASVHRDGTQGQVPTGQCHLATCPTPHVVVCVSLVCCEPKASLDPAGAVLGAKLYPHVMVMTNFDLEHDDALVSVINMTRPAALAHQHHVGDERRQMKSKLDFLLMTDSNRKSNNEGLEGKHKASNFDWSPLVPDLEWDIIFDYFDEFPSVGEEIVVVDPELPRRPIGGGMVAYANANRDDEFWKMARQGEFDNLHIAPPMQHPAFEGGNSYAYPCTKDGKPIFNGRTTYTLDELKALAMDRIAMAPVCVHDCLHIHWRWGDAFGEKWVRGWGENGPNTVEGAPMVPLNQRVSIKLLRDEGVGLDITTKIKKNVHAGRWQVVNPQGAGYAVAPSPWIGWAASINASLLEGGWWHFYWKLRYVVEDKDWSYGFGGIGRKAVEVKERVMIKDLPGLRKA